MILAPHFTVEEMLKSSDHPDLAGGIHDTPPDVLVNLSRLTWSVLHPLRQRFGGPIIITSGYRPRALNSKVNGSDTSRHLSGCAVDFVMRHPAAQAWAEICNSGIRDWDRLAFYARGEGRFHADIDPESEHQRGLLYLGDGDGDWRPV
jgi:hypothetical protein